MAQIAEFSTFSLQNLILPTCPRAMSERMKVTENSQKN